MDKDSTFVLVHSPLVGPLTWSRVAAEMQSRGLSVIVPALEDSVSSKEPFWRQHAESVARSLSNRSKDPPVILVAHSGSGPLLPAIRQSLSNPVQAYVFVDAGLPRDGATRLDLMKWEDPSWAQEFRAYLEGGGRFPDWSSEELGEILPDNSLREQMVAELRPRGLDFFSEPIPVFAAWPDVPCVYILFSPPYRRAIEEARRMGWVTSTLESGHFHMLVDPGAVVDQILAALNKTRQTPR